MSGLEETLAWQLKAAGLVPEREYAFAKEVGRRFRFDFAFPQSRLAVELDGGVWLKKGRHTTGSGFTRDCEKGNLAVQLGWKVLRFTGQHVRDGSALRLIEEVLKSGPAGR